MANKVFILVAVVVAGAILSHAQSINGADAEVSNVNTFDSFYNSVFPEKGTLGFNNGFFGFDANYYYSLLLHSVLGVGPFNDAGQFMNFGNVPGNAYCCGGQTSSIFKPCREDKEPPRMNCPINVFSTTVNPTISVSADDDECGVASIVRPNAALTQGDNEVTYEAIDAAGNRAQCTVRVRVETMNCFSSDVGAGWNRLNAGAAVPTVTWGTNVGSPPAGTQSFAIVLDDVTLDPPLVTAFAHDIPVGAGNQQRLTAGGASGGQVNGADVTAGLNDFGATTMQGFDVNHLRHKAGDTHQYRVRVYALNTNPVAWNAQHTNNNANNPVNPARARPTFEEWFARNSGNVIGECSFTSSYTRET